MLAQRLVAVARPLALRRAVPVTSSIASRSFIVGPDRDFSTPLDPVAYPRNDPAKDPGMNGGYINPTPERRQFRDPYGDWWDKQERRNFGEAAHEDNDMLGRFTPEAYTWIASPQKGLFQIGLFISTVLALSGTVYMVYPDKPAVPREFPHNGLEIALGGKGCVLAKAEA
ncbi:hypothetical protein EX30DRAFT_180224 [Ascodesmis nigricans]|uniref:NADH:ubiquinone oxidoreductase 20.1kD subunit n=1 Tax=Ascodesmis nigricans TaxID=341454 RepID=A0A4S2MQQ3_9PEZI|nr:hypothetical protein EX30DRAFT_180224 [Ascodesmis nigricans]